MLGRNGLWTAAGGDVCVCREGPKKGQCAKRPSQVRTARRLTDRHTRQSSAAQQREGERIEGGQGPGMDGEQGKCGGEKRVGGTREGLGTWALLLPWSMIIPQLCFPSIRYVLTYYCCYYYRCHYDIPESIRPRVCLQHAMRRAAAPSSRPVQDTGAHLRPRARRDHRRKKEPWAWGGPAPGSRCAARKPLAHWTDGTALWFLALGSWPACRLPVPLSRPVPGPRFTNWLLASHARELLHCAAPLLVPSLASRPPARSAFARFHTCCSLPVCSRLCLVALGL